MKITPKQKNTRFFAPRWFGLILFVSMLVLLLSACFSDDDGSDGVENMETWTYIMYMALDEHGEEGSTYEMIKLQNVSSSKNVKFVVEVDRAVGLDESYGHWTDARRFRIKEDIGTEASGGDYTVQQEDAIKELEKNPAAADYAVWKPKLENGAQNDLDSFMLDRFFGKVRPLPGGYPNSGANQTSLMSMGEINTGDPDHFVDFVTWAIENYPADHYILSILGHGAGMFGMGMDLTSDQADLFTLDEMDSAFNTILTRTGIGEFDLVVWHACIMSQLDVMGALAPYAHYVAASEESLDLGGWDYLTTFNQLNDNPGLSVLEVGKNLVDNTLDFYRNDHPYARATHHLIDLSKTNNTLDAVKQFAAMVSVDSKDALTAIGLARNETPTFYQGDTDTNASDLIRFMELLAERSTDEDTKQSAWNVISAASDMVVYGESNDGHPNANGLSIYFPSNRTTYTSTSVGLNPSELYPVYAPYMEGWRTFLNKFYDAMDAEIGTSQPGINMKLASCCSAPYSFQNPPPMVLTTEGVGLVSLQFTVMWKQDNGLTFENYSYPIHYKAYSMDKQPVDIDIPEGLMDNDFLWHAWVPTLSDGKTETMVAIRALAADPGEVKVYGHYYPADGSEFRDAFLLIEDKDGGKALTLKAIQRTGAPVTDIIYTSPGDRFQPTFRQLVGDYLDDPAPLFPDQWLTFGDAPFTVHYRAATEGNYKLRLDLTDMAGHTSTSFVEVAVDNQGLDTAFRGYAGIELGAKFLIPVGWTWMNIEDSQLAGTDTVMRIITETGSSTDITATSFPAKASLDADLQAFTAQLDDVGPISAPVSLDVNGHSAYLIEYDSSVNAVTGFHYRTSIVHEPVSGVSYTITLTSPQGSADTGLDVFQKVLETISFFERTEYKKP
jgi:hypothetical protein